MANLIYFVTETWLKENTVITRNVDIVDVLPLVKTAADMWTRSTLGTYFYNDLLTKYNAQTLNSDETIAVSYIQPAVAWRAAADATIEKSYQLKNKGIQTQSGDYSASAEYKAVMWVSQHYTQKAEFYENRLFEYLKENKDLFPNFTSILNKDSTAKNAICCGPNPNFNQNIMFI